MGNAAGVLSNSPQCEVSVFFLDLTVILTLVFKSVSLLLLSVVAYSVVMGALMASGKEVIGRIPRGKVKIGPLQRLFYMLVSSTNKLLRCY